MYKYKIAKIIKIAPSLNIQKNIENETIRPSKGSFSSFGMNAINSVPYIPNS